MKFVRLGRTDVRVSVVGLGCGGSSRLGLRYGNSLDQAATVVRGAIDLGVTFIDTAELYGTEEAVGLGIRGRREALFLSTKTRSHTEAGPLVPAGLRAKVEASLKRLGTDRIDLFNLHGVAPAEYAYCIEVLLPELERLRDEGKIRFLGITEAFGRDTDHRMLRGALPDDRFDVVMVGFSLLNPSARRSVFPLTLANDVGTLIMFAVRRALSNPDALVSLLADLERDGALPRGTSAERLEFLTHEPGVRTLIEAAYRFCRYEPGADVVLTGTGSLQHLRENIDAILAPPLPDRVLDQLERLFGSLASVSGN